MPQTPRRMPGRQTAGTPMCRRQAAALGVLATVLLAGCGGTSVTPGQPEAPPTTGAPTSSQQAVTPTSSTPARPADLDLTGKDPCNTADPAALTGLNYRVPGLPGKTGPTQIACSFRFDRTIDGTALFFDTTTAVEIPDRPPTGTVVAAIEVAGYPAYTVADQMLGACTVKVDVHDGQTLSTLSDGSTSEPVAPLCDRATQFAALAIVGLAGR